MMNGKKLLAVFTAVMIWLLNINVFAVTADSAMSGIYSESYERDIELVKSLGIMKGYEDGSSGAERNITRMEFAAIIVRLLGNEDMARTYTKSIFSDVDDNSWGKGYVAVAHYLKYIDGNGDGTFGPDNNTTFDQAYKIMVSALGYKDDAQNIGGYPEGYLLMAGKLEITKGLESGDTYITRGAVARLITNSLGVKVLDAAEMDGREKHSQSKSDETLLEKLEFYRAEGILTAVYGINTGSGIVLNKNQIKIGNEIFDTVIADCSPYILKRVRYYAKKNEDGADTVCFMEERKYGKDELIVDAEDIDRDATTLSEFVYYNSVKNKFYTEKLPEDLIIIYNGDLVSTADYRVELLKPDSGSVMLIDSDDDGRYEYAVVYEYEDYVVEAVNLPKVYDIFSKTLYFDNAVTLGVFLDGTEVKLEDIQLGDVLSVAESINGERVRIEISRETVSGCIDIKSKDEAGRTVYTVDGTEYPFAGRYNREYENGSAKIKRLDVGDSVKLYLDVFGKIAASELTETGKSGAYGYLIDMYRGSRPEEVVVKLMTTENKMEIFNCTDRMVFGRNTASGYTTKRFYASEIYDMLRPNDKITMQIVKYSLDDKGRMTKLYLADKTRFSDNFSLDVSRNSRIYSNGVYGGKYILNNDTAWFDIPESGLYTDLFSAGHAPNFLKSNSYYTLELYDVEDNTVGAVFCKSTSPRYLTYESKVIVDKVNSPVMLIDKVTTAVVDDDEVYLCVSGYVDFEYVTVPVSRTVEGDPLAVNGLRRGAVIQYETNYAERKRAETSENLEVLWVYNTLHDFNITSGDFYRKWENTDIESNNAGIGTIYGIVTDVNFPYFTVRYNSPDGNEETALMQMGAQSAVYSYERGKWSKNEQRDVQVGETLFIRTRYNRIREIVLFKN